MTYSERSGRAAVSTPSRRTLKRPPPAWNAASSSNSGVAALSRSKSGYEIHAPAILRPAFHAAVVAFADPVQPGRIGDRQRPEHHGMDERENRRGAADAERQRQDGRCR